MTAAPRGTDPDPPVRRPMDSVFIDSPTVNLVHSDLIFFFLFSLFLFFSSSWIQPNRMSINRYSQRDGKKRFCQSNQEHFFFLFRSCCCAFPRRVTKGVSPNLTDTTARGSDGWNEEKIPSSGRTRRSSGPITPNGRQKEMRRIRMMFDLKGKIK